MITREDSVNTYEYGGHFVIYPNYDWWGRKRIIPGGRRVEEGFAYSSGENAEWLTIEDIQKLLKADAANH